MKKNIIFNHTQQEYNKKYRNCGHRLLKFTKKEVEDFNKKNPDIKGYLLKNRKWWLIGDTYYEVPKAPRWVWFRNLNKNVQISSCVVLSVGVLSATIFPILTNTIWKPVPATYNVTLNAKKVGHFEEKQQTKTIAVKENTLLKDVISDVKPTNYLDGTFVKYTFDIIGKQRIKKDYRINSDVTVYAQYSYSNSEKSTLLYSNYTDTSKDGRTVTLNATNEVEIDWGDQSEKETKTKFSHTYDSVGTYTITVTGDSGSIRFTSSETNDNEVGLLSEGNKHIVGFNLSKHATTIPNNAFNGMSDLTEVYISDEVTAIGDSAFNNCSSLYLIGVPNKVESIGDSAFKGCDSLEYVIIGDGVNSIGTEAFSGLSNLEYIYVGEGNDTYTSRDSNKKEINSIIGKGQSGEHDTLLFGSSNTVIPETVTTIADNALVNNSKIKTIEIPSSVTNIGKNNFTGCESLEKVTVSEDNSVYTSRDAAGNETNAIMKDDGKGNVELIVAVDDIPDVVTDIKPHACANMTNITTFEWPSNLKRIGEYAFYECSNLLNVNIPASVSEIGYVNGSNELKPETVFKGCNGLLDITVDSGNEVYTDYNGSQVIAKKDGNVVLRGCVNTDFGKLSKSDAKEINQLAFEGAISGLLGLPRKIDLSDSKITKIGQGAFAFCTNIGQILLPKGLTEINENTFQACVKLSSVTMPENPYTIAKGAFGHCLLLNSIDLTNATWIGEEAFSSNFSLYHIKFGPKLTYIGVKAFEFCFNWQLEDTPEIVFTGDTTGVELAIDQLAFQYCTYLKEVTLPASAKKFGSAVFARCDNLVTCDLSKIDTMVTSLETDKGPNSTFQHCQHMKKGGIGKIIVPSRLLKKYKKDAKWKTYQYNFEAAA